MVDAMLRAETLVGFVPITDATRARTFYCDVLGLELQHQDDFAVVVDAGGTPLRLTVVPEVPEPTGTTIGWLVADLARTMGELAGAGIEFERFPAMDQDDAGVWNVPGGGASLAWFRDPDGNRLSLTQTS